MNDKTSDIQDMRGTTEGIDDLIKVLKAREHVYKGWKHVHDMHPGKFSGPHLKERLVHLCKAIEDLEVAKTLIFSATCGSVEQEHFPWFKDW